MSDEYNTVEGVDETPVDQPTDESADQPADESNEGSSNLRRGRPRDPGVIERDGRVLDALSSGEPKTKAQLAEELSLAPNTVYLSLWRLHKEGRVARSQRQWQLAQA